MQSLIWIQINSKNILYTPDYKAALFPSLRTPQIRFTLCAHNFSLNHRAFTKYYSFESSRWKLSNELGRVKVRHLSGKWCVPKANRIFRFCSLCAHTTFHSQMLQLAALVGRYFIGRLAPNQLLYCSQNVNTLRFYFKLTTSNYFIYNYYCTRRIIKPHFFQASAPLRFGSR